MKKIDIILERRSLRDLRKRLKKPESDLSGSSVHARKIKEVPKKSFVYEISVGEDFDIAVEMIMKRDLSLKCSLNLFGIEDRKPQFVVYSDYVLGDTHPRLETCFENTTVYNLLSEKISNQDLRDISGSIHALERRAIRVLSGN